MINIEKLKDIFSDYPDIVSVNDLMKMLGVGKNTAYKLINEKKIKSVDIGRIHKIPKYCIIDYIMGSN
jgi:excisionase family DNA binding protein